MLSAGTTVFGKNIYVSPDKEFKPKKLSVPYGFYNEHFGASVAYVYGLVGYPQKQSALLGTVMAGSFKDANSYTDGNPQFANERAGTNDSNEDNSVEAAVPFTTVAVTCSTGPPDDSDAMI